MSGERPTLAETLYQVESLDWEFFPEPDLAVADVAHAALAWVLDVLADETLVEEGARRMLADADPPDPGNLPPADWDRSDARAVLAVVRERFEAER